MHLYAATNLSRKSDKNVVVVVPYHFRNNKCNYANFHINFIGVHVLTTMLRKAIKYTRYVVHLHHGKFVLTSTVCSMVRLRTLTMVRMFLPAGRVQHDRLVLYSYFAVFVSVCPSVTVWGGLGTGQWCGSWHAWLVRASWFVASSLQKEAMQYWYYQR